MSVYTVIYPDLKDFPRDKYNSIDELIKDKNEVADKINIVWNKLTALAYATPKDLQETVRNFEIAWGQLIGNLQTEYYYNRVIELWEDEQYHKNYDTDKSGNYKLSLCWNNFKYSNNLEFGIEEEKKLLNKYLNTVLGICCATPKDIVPKDCDNESIIDYLYNYLKELRTEIEDSVNRYLFCMLCVKYKDTMTIN